MVEGSYPYIIGGVSTWIHDLILGLPHLDFVIWTLVADAKLPIRYTLPANVVDHQILLLNEAPPSNKGSGLHSQALEKSINLQHMAMFNEREGDLAAMIREIPEGSWLHGLTGKRPRLWKILVNTNQARNPAYPFADYYWAWESAHQLLFTTLAAKAPKADIYHAVSTGFAGLAALAAKIRHKRPFLLTEHGLYHKEREMEIRKAHFVHGYQRDMWIRMYNRLSKISYQSADRITALFEENRLAQIELGAPKEKCSVIPNGIRPGSFAVERKPRPGYHIGLIGRVVPIKDIKTFIVCAKFALDMIPDLTFYCIGPTDEDPAYFDDCKLLVQSLHLQEHFQFTGRQNVKDYYCFLDLIVLTSIREGQPLVILEAWDAGIPVVSSNVGNIGEMLDWDADLLAPSKDPAGLADRIVRLINNPELRVDLAKKNTRRLENLYSGDKVLEQFNTLYQDLASLGEIL